MISAKKNSVLMKVGSVKALLGEVMPRPKDQILIINAGPGDLPLALLNKYTKTIDLTCTDSNIHMLELTKEKLADFSNVRIQSSKIGRLPFTDGFFDIVISVDDIGFIKDKARFLEELKRVMKPKGSLFLTSYHPVGIMAWFRELDWVCFEKGYHGRVDRKVMRKLFKEAGLDLLRTRVFKVLDKKELILAKGVKR